MLTITDHDLLIIEPSVFSAAVVAGTTLLNVTDATVSGTALTSATSDFAALDIGEAHVAVVNGVAVEVLSRASATQLQVSRPRAADSDPAIAPGDGNNLTLQIISFARLIRRITESTLLALGIDEDHPTVPLAASAIANPAAVQQFIALRVIHHAFVVVAAIAPSDQSLADRAVVYSRQAAIALARAAAVVDIDGDGRPDGTRRLGVVTFIRN